MSAPSVSGPERSATPAPRPAPDAAPALTPPAPAIPGLSLPARPAPAPSCPPATNAAVRRPSAPGAVQSAGLPPRPRTPEGGWRSGIPRGALAGSGNNSQQHRYWPSSARGQSSRPRDQRSGFGGRGQQQGAHHQQHRGMQHPAAPGPVMPYQPTLTTTTTPAVAPQAFTGFPPPVLPPTGYGGYYHHHQPQQQWQSQQHQQEGGRGGNPQDEENRHRFNRGRR